MEKQQYRISINAPREKVWNALWDMKNYQAWTSAFAEGSQAETDNWKKGTKVLFTDGKGQGMVSRVVDNKPNEFMSFEHLGELKDGKEDTTSEKVSSWAGSHENYTLVGQNGNTELIVDIDVAEEWKGFFDEAWPKAMEKIKSLAEA